MARDMESMMRRETYLPLIGLECVIHYRSVSGEEKKAICTVQDVGDKFLMINRKEIRGINDSGLSLIEFSQIANVKWTEKIDHMIPSET